MSGGSFLPPLIAVYVYIIVTIKKPQNRLERPGTWSSYSWARCLHAEVA